MAKTVNHGVEFRSDPDGWVFASCLCRKWKAGPFPAVDDAADAYGDHRFSVVAKRLGEAVGRCKHCCNRRGGWCKGCSQDIAILGITAADHPKSKRGQALGMSS